jgi:uncharacterized protein
MSDCCGGPPSNRKPKAAGFDLLSTRTDAPTEPEPACCGGNKTARFDAVLWISSGLFLIGAALGFFRHSIPHWAQEFSDTCLGLARQSWWAILTGIIVIAILAHTPREMIAAILGKPGSLRGILRSTAAGVFLDLCNHGILMVGMGLYKRGASLGQTIAFLIASPWNSFSLTLLLAALIGWKWMLCFLLLSALIGITTGCMAEWLTKRGHLPANPNTVTLPAHFTYRASWQEMRRALHPSASNLIHLARTGLRDSRMVLRWILLGFVLTACVKAFVPPEWLHQHYGPTLWGLGLTLLTTTILEVCSEGSAPLAAELLRGANAPGNAFTFLMAGAATDYTEILSLKSTTASWLCALILPMLSVPQVLLLACWMNQFGSP